MVHIEDVYAMFVDFTNKLTLMKTKNLRGAVLNKAMVEAINEIKAFCVKHNLPIDFTERE